MTTVLRSPRRPDLRAVARALGRAWLRRTPLQQDLLLAVGACVVGMSALVLEPENALRGVRRSADPLAVGLVVGMTLPLAWRRRAPVLALALPAVCAVVAIDRGYAAVLTAFFVMFGLGSAARFTDRRTSVLLGVAAIAVAIGLSSSETSGGPSYLNLMVGLLAGGAPAVIGDAFRVQAELAAEVREHALALDRLREAEVGAAITQERVGMARDMHDIVGHHLSAIALHVHAAERIAERDPSAVRRSLGQVGHLTTEALAETRRMLEVLRTDETELAPSPRLSDVGHLVEKVRAGGVPVELRVEGHARELPGGVETCAYRIVQEALTNVSRHARPAQARVTLRYDGSCLVLTVEDDGRPLAARPAATARQGHGLIGMHERAGLVGGEVEAGPASGGGWRVRATLPVGAA